MDVDPQDNNLDLNSVEELEAKLAKDKAYLLSIQKDLDELDKQILKNGGEPSGSIDYQELVKNETISDWPLLESSACVFS
jgi:hypothetical protein